MNTLHFKYAVEIEKTRSITQAAENLYMAQPNMSKAIKELENTLGITIFRRTSKGVIPTEQGMKFLSYAKQVLIQIDNMEAIHSPDKLQKQKMKISVPRSSYISTAFAEFSAGFDMTESVDAVLNETNALQTIADVRENSYDFGIIRYKKEHEKYFLDYLAERSLDHQLVWEFEMMAVMSENHPSAGLEKLLYDDLRRDHTEICHGDNGIPYHLRQDSPHASECAAEAGNKRRIGVFDRATRFDLLYSVPGAFMLDAPASEAQLSRMGLIQRRCCFEGNCYDDMLIYASGHKLAESEIQFVNKVFEVRNRLAFGNYY